MIDMGYTETNSWSIDEATHGTPMAGTKWTLAVQTFTRKGVGADAIAKAKELNENALGSAWSTPLTKVTLPASE